MSSIKHIGLVFFSLFIQSQQIVKKKEDSVTSVLTPQVKEQFFYRIHYGWFNAGIASIESKNVIIDANDTDKKSYLQVDVHGKSSGFIKFFSTVNDHWGVYIDTTTMLPYRSYRYIQEGKYIKNEIVDFDHLAHKATVSNLDGNRKLIDTVQYTFPSNTHDIVSVCWSLRSIDSRTLQVGDTAQFTVFFDHVLHLYKARFLGKKKLRTKLGKFQALCFAPIIPDNKLFRSKNPLKVWFSADQNKIPLKIQINLLIGSLVVDIKKIVK